MSNYNASFLGQLAQGVWTYDLNSNPNISPLSISGYFVSSIGRFDNLTSSCFYAIGNSGNPAILGITGDSAWNYDIVDPTNPSGNLLGDPEANILRGIYLLTYYEGLIQAMSGPGLFVGVGSFGNSPTQSNLPLVKLKEGDSEITWADASKLMAVYEKVLDQKRKELNYLVEAYNRNSNGSEIPRSLAFFNIISPNAGAGWNAYSN